MRGKYTSDPSDRTDRSDSSDGTNPADQRDHYNLATVTEGVAAHTLICLINQASFLLGRQLQSLEQRFLREGGFTEHLYQARMARR